MRWMGIIPQHYPNIKLNLVKVTLLNKIRETANVNRLQQQPKKNNTNRQEKEENYVNFLKMDTFKFRY